VARIGVFLCWCGENIARTVDVARVAELSAQIPGVRCALDYKYMCSDPGQSLLRDKIAANGWTVWWWRRVRRTCI
jgi:heterodisulfide reductase subunit A